MLYQLSLQYMCINDAIRIRGYQPSFSRLDESSKRHTPIYQAMIVSNRCHQHFVHEEPNILEYASSTSLATPNNPTITI